MQPTKKKEKAKVAVEREARPSGGSGVHGGAPCVHWLKKGSCTRKGKGCSYNHDPKLQGDTSAMPVCHGVLRCGKCMLPKEKGECWYKHPEVGMAARAAPAPAPAPDPAPAQAPAPAAGMDSRVVEMLTSTMEMVKGLLPPVPIPSLSLDLGLTLTLTLSLMMT